MGKESDIPQGDGVFARPGRKRKHLKPYTTLYESNMRDVPKTLRKIAKEIEAGEYGNVHEAALVLDTAKQSNFVVFGFGPQAGGAYSTMAMLELGIGELRHNVYDSKEIKASENNGSDK
jgi:hypothetical protein